MLPKYALSVIWGIKQYSLCVWDLIYCINSMAVKGYEANGYIWTKLLW